MSVKKSIYIFSHHYVYMKKHITICVALFLIILISLAHQSRQEPFIPRFVKEQYHPMERTVRHHVHRWTSYSGNLLSNFGRRWRII